MRGEKCRRLPQTRGDGSWGYFEYGQHFHVRAGLLFTPRPIGIAKSTPYARIDTTLF